MVQRGIDFQAEGLLDGLDGDQRGERLALLRHLESEGVPLREIRRRSQAGTLIFGTADRVLGEDTRMTVREVSTLSGVDVEMLNAAHRAMGLPVPDADEAEYTDADLRSARMINVARAAGLSDDDLLELLRVLGRGLWGAAEALRELPMKLVLRPGMSERDLADAYARVVAELHPLLDPLMSNMLTLHLRHAAQSEVISEMERRGGDLPGSREVAVCFADLVGFTRIGEEVPPLELGRLAMRLDAIAADIARAPVRLVKTIGDAAMLTSPDPQALLDSALALIAAADSEGEDFPQLRAGAALGAALPRAGDWYRQAREHRQPGHVDRQTGQPARGGRPARCRPRELQVVVRGRAAPSRCPRCRAALQGASAGRGSEADRSPDLEERSAGSGAHGVLVPHAPGSTSVRPHVVECDRVLVGVHALPEPFVRARAQLPVGRKPLQWLPLEDAVLVEAVEHLCLEQKNPPLIQCSERGFSTNPVTRPSAASSVTPNCRRGRTTVMLAAAPCSRWKASRARRSTSDTPSAYVTQNVPCPASRGARRLIRPPVWVSRPVSTQLTLTPSGQLSPAAKRSISSCLYPVASRNRVNPWAT